MERRLNDKLKVMVTKEDPKKAKDKVNKDDSNDEVARYREEKCEGEKIKKQKAVNNDHRIPLKARHRRTIYETTR